MREIHFSEDQLRNIQALGQDLFDEGASDPRSWNYQRKLIRPTIAWWRIIIFVIALTGGTLGLYFLLVMLTLPPAVAICLSLASAFVVFLLYLKRILICLVRIYQRFAPASIRNKCRFEPSCSQYMILSLQKYGLRKGLAKGVNRLRRCHTQDGGFDYP